MGPKKPVGQELGQAWKYDTLGYTFAFSVILWAGAGYLLDRVLGTMPFLTILGTLVGAGLAFLWVFLKVRQDEDGFRARHRPPTEPPAP
ncbi:MAG: AtpZ/AtpI family protein [Gemmatimonadetes bacterium]|nr:AtpZ/AtpI family protein [Gemmatimonadota bacterium]MBP6668674.1 AtpZ/AtpI family protein [Gemmatimonadales bacterium]MBK6780272.1 AtpZ/AtpI family protein [Gemmatimonadota bacterium]MBK7351013.1 AtpZ/AtpI family protein [Gemmatimonadota bacterium]MBK7714988.1 AtpZ/AtpI family protein [Gemmatimonadota bacterium]